MSMIKIKTHAVYERMFFLMLTPSKLAEDISVSRMVMDKILSQGICSPITLCNIARVLRVKPKELME